MTDKEICEQSLEMGKIVEKYGWKIQTGDIVYNSKGLPSFYIVRKGKRYKFYNMTSNLLMSGAHTAIKILLTEYYFCKEV